MSWKMYSLGSLSYAKNVANAALPVLENLGYSPSYTNVSNNKGVLSVTIGGVVHSAGLYAQSSTFPYYLFVNDETNDILITISHQNTGAGNNWCYSVGFAILSGTSLLNGDAGVFPIADTDISPTRISNAWYNDKPAEPGLIVLQKAVFFKCASYPDYNTNYFESTLYFASHPQTPGVVITVGVDSFVCLAGLLYAKL